MMQSRRLTISTARGLDYEDLLERCEEVFQPYSPPEDGIESEAERIQRLSRTIDEMPEIYRWFLQLKAYFDHWTDAEAHMKSTRDIEYKLMRQRRDAMDSYASAAKKRYEGASRQITIIEGFDQNGMPRSRKDTVSQ